MKNPYPGLRPFDEGYAPFFFGRDRQISELADLLRRHRFVGVVGLSGSGKSSLVRAGLLPALRAGQLGLAGSDWRIAILRPSENPVATLTETLNTDEILGTCVDRETDLAGSSFGLIERTKTGRSPTTNLLVFVDQFEDVFRFVQEGKLDAQRAAHFIKLLLAVAEEPRREFPVYVVITMRSEYVGQCARFYGLPEVLNRSQYLVPRLTPEELREAIEAPAVLTDVEPAPALVQRLLVDASAVPDDLPRLQHLLMRLWELRDESESGGSMTLQHYRLEEIGGMANCLNLHAEETYGALSEREKEIAERIFQRLTMSGETGQDARRPAPITDLAAVANAPLEAVAKVVQHFQSAQFLTEIPATGGGHPLVDLTHESLIPNWKRLKVWVHKEARHAEIYRSLAKDNRPLWGDGEISEAIKWRDDFHPNEAWSRRYEVGRLSLALDVLRRLELDRSAAERRRRLVILGLASAALAFFGLFAWAMWERKRAEVLRTVSLARQLAADSSELLATSPRSSTTSALLAVESMLRQPLLKSHAALRQATLLMPSQIARLSHEDRIIAVAFSIDGRVATGSSDKTARVMEAANGKELARLVHGDSVNAVDFSPDGKWVATGSSDKTARVMEAATGKEVARLVHSDSVEAVDFSPDGKWVATGSWDKTARVMEAATGIQVASLFHEGRVIAVDFSPDGKWVATGSSDKTARVMEAATGKEVARLVHGDSVNAVDFSPDSKRVATGSSDMTARVMEAATGKEVAHLAHEGTVGAVAFSPDGEWVATGSSDRGARLMEATTGKEVARLAHEGTVNAVAFDLSGKLVATGSSDTTVRVLEVATRRQIACMPHEGPASAVAFSPDGRWLATGGSDKTVRVMQAGTSVAHVPCRSTVAAVTVSSDGRLVATGGSENMMRVTEVGTGNQVARLAHEGTVGAVAFSPDGKWLATGSWDKTARVIEVATSKQVAYLAHEGPVVAVAFSSESKWLATGGSDGTARVMEVTTGKEVARFVHESTVCAVAFSPDGKWLATGSVNMARVTEVVTGKEVARLAHGGTVGAVAFSPDGKWLATGSWDKTARVIDVATGTHLVRLVHGDRVPTVAFSPDGKWVATGSSDKMARIVEATTGKETIRHEMSGPVNHVRFLNPSVIIVAARPSSVEVVDISQVQLMPKEIIRDSCFRLPRNLTSDEWKRYLPDEPYRETCSDLPPEPAARTSSQKASY